MNNRPLAAHKMSFISLALAIALMLLLSGNLIMTRATTYQYPPPNEPITWDEFHPHEWINTSIMTSSITVSPGLSLLGDTARYRYSLVDGIQWTEWFSATSKTISNTLFIEVNNLVVAEGQANRIQFAVSDSDGMHWTSDEYIISLDVHTPTLSINVPHPSDLITGSQLTVSGHVTDELSGPNQILIQAGAEKLSGTLELQDWEGVWTLPITDHVPFTITAIASDLATNTVSESITITIDNQAPQNPTLITESTGITNGAVLTTAIPLEFTWNEPLDGSGIAGYYIAWSDDPNEDEGRFITKRQSDDNVLRPGRRYYFRMSTVDQAGNAAPWETLFTATLEPERYTIYMPMLKSSFEPNNTLRTAHGPLLFGQEYKSFIAPAGDQDYYFVDVQPPSTTLQITLTNIPHNTDYDLYLYDSIAATAPVAFSNQFGQVDETITYIYTAKNRLFIRIYPYEGFSAEDPYSLIANTR